MKLIDKQVLIDDLLLAAMDKNTFTTKEVYNMIEKQKVIKETGDGRGYGKT